MSTKQRLDNIMRDPVIVHAELKRRGSNFSDIARSLSTKDRPISPQLVRVVVYGVPSKHKALILDEIRKVLSGTTAPGSHVGA